MSQVKNLDFSGQSIYCGIDVHKKNWSVSLRTEDRELKTFSQDADPIALARLLHRQYPNAEFQLAYEAGFCGFWIQQQFAREGLRCMVIHPADIPQPNRDRLYKTDPVNSRRIAFELSKGSLRSIHIPSEETLALRSLVRTRLQLVKDQTRYKNRILSFLDFLGIAIPAGYKTSTRFNGVFLQWLKELPIAEHHKRALESKMNILQSTRQELLQITRQFRGIAKTGPYQRQISLLTSIPGIGLTSAIVLMAEIDDIRRFRKFDQLASLAGFKPDVYSSAEKKLVKGLTHHCNHLLRETLVECAWMAVGRDPALTQAYQHYKKRMHYNKAIIRIAKKLLSRVRHVLLSGQPYQMGIVE